MDCENALSVGNALGAGKLEATGVVGVEALKAAEKEVAWGSRLGDGALTGVTGEGEGEAGEAAGGAKGA